MKWQDKIPNSVVYVTSRLKIRGMTFAGNCFRSRFSAPQPIMNLILWRYKGEVSRGALI